MWLEGEAFLPSSVGECEPHLSVDGKLRNKHTPSCRTGFRYVPGGNTGSLFHARSYGTALSEAGWHLCVRRLSKGRGIKEESVCEGWGELPCPALPCPWETATAGGGSGGARRGRAYPAAGREEPLCLAGLRRGARAPRAPSKSRRIPAATGPQ